MENITAKISSSQYFLEKSVQTSFSNFLDCNVIKKKTKTND